MRPRSVDQALEEALERRAEGHLAEAETICREVLARHPEHPGALHLLGLLAAQVGRAGLSVELLRKAVAVEPGDAGIRASLGNALQAAGQIPAAIESYQAALRLEPGQVDVQSNLGAALCAAGRCEEAIATCREALVLDAAHSAAWNNLGRALHAAGRPGEALDALRQAVRLAPGSAEAHNNLAASLHDTRAFEEAITACREALRLKPDYARAHNNLANSLHALGRFEEAVAAARRALELKPDFPEAFNSLATALFGLRRLDEAAAACRAALRLRPAYWVALFNLGNILRARGCLDEAAAAYGEAIGRKDDSAEAHHNLASVFFEQRQYDAAIASSRRAIQLKPGSAYFHSLLGSALHQAGRIDEAMVACRDAIRIDPVDADAHCHLGNVLHSAGRIDEAVSSYRCAVRIQPCHAEAHNKLANCLKNLGLIDPALSSYRQAIALQPGIAQYHSNLLFALHLHADHDAASLLAEARQWDRCHAQPLACHIRPHANDPSPDRRLRIGWVSPDFRDHMIGRMLVPLLREHDHKQFEIFSYACVERPDAVTVELRSLSDEWRDIFACSDGEAARIIRADRIDVLVDLSSHRRGNRLLTFAQKPAPVQVTYLSFCGTTGMASMDYRLSDPFLDPPGVDTTCYSEETIRLRRTFWCYEPLGPCPEPAPPPVLSAGHLTLGCLNHFGKVLPQARELWMEILKAIPRSQLLLMAPPGGCRDEIRQCLVAFGIPVERVNFVEHQPWRRYIRGWGQIDIALDPFPYGGGITTCDALWMGVPVISLSGRTAVGRGGRSILCNIGLPEFVAESPQEYVEIAVSLARDLPRLVELRATLRERMERSPLRDAKGFARDIEAAYREMWRKWCLERSKR